MLKGVTQLPGPIGSGHVKAQKTGESSVNPGTFALTRKIIAPRPRKKDFTSTVIARSEATKQSRGHSTGLLRRFAPRNDAISILAT